MRVAATLLFLAGSAWAPPAAAAACSEPPLLAPSCGAAPATGLTGGATASEEAACRLALETYILSLDRWSFCVRNEVALRTLEARRRLDCLARRQGLC